MKTHEAIRFYRQLAFLSQNELAAATGIPQYRLSRIESGQSKPTEKEFKQLTEALDLSPADLQGGACTRVVESTLRERGAIGKPNGIDESELCRALNVNERALRKLIQKERISGALICNNYGGGYYIAATAREKQQFIKSRMAVVKTLSRECKPFRDSLKASGESPCC